MFSPGIIGGRFHIFAELGSGGFGQTFLAEDLMFPHQPKCVVKQLKTASTDEKIFEVARRLFEQESQVLYKVGDHPQIPSLIAHFEENGEFYLVQEYVEGETLEQQLTRGKIYKQSEVINLARQLLEILSFVHSQGVIHRDLKPANIISRSSDGKIVLIDFGSVKQISNENPNLRMQTETIAVGSNGYMPPEQLAGHPRFSSDLYAAGMLTIQLFTQTHPTRFVQNRRTGEWIWQDKATVNPHLAELLSRMIRFDFRRRFSTATEALAAFRKLDLYTLKRVAVEPDQDQSFFSQPPTNGNFNQNNPPPQADIQKTNYAPSPNLQQKSFQSIAVQPKKDQSPHAPDSSSYKNQTPLVSRKSGTTDLPADKKTENSFGLTKLNNFINASLLRKAIMYVIIIGLIFWFCSWLVREAADVKSYQDSRGAVISLENLGETFSRSKI